MAKNLVYNFAIDRIDKSFLESFEYNSKYSENATLLSLIEITPASILKTDFSSNFLMPRTTFKISKPTYLALIFLLSHFIANPVLASSLIELVKFQKNRSWENWRNELKKFGLEHGGYDLYDILSDRDFLQSMATNTVVIGLSIVGTLLFENRKKATIPAVLSVLPELIAKYSLPEIASPIPIFNETVGVCRVFSASKFIPNLPTFQDKIAEMLFPILAAYTCQMGQGGDSLENIPPCVFSVDVTADVEHIRSILSEGKVLFEFFTHHAIDRENWSSMEAIMELANRVENNVPDLIRFCIEHGGSRSEEFYPLPPHA
jgi:hypothetical protein